MQKTKFLSPTDKQRMIDSAKSGNEKAESSIYNELDRLERRIKSLELGMELLFEKSQKTNDQNPSFI